ncbi:MAG TPA: class I SAM-dependent methyltransferase [Solirubrobacterales bacterium]|nr:class I SAM-dependent methyltransferase [Solirubrobacterales bacterium]
MAGGYDAQLFGRLAAVEDESFWFRARNRLLVQTVSGLARPGDRFLEIGCGTGYVLRALAEECGLEVTGSELFGEAFEHARRRVPGAELVELDAREMPYEGEFDLVGAFDVLEHIDDDVGVLRGLRQALRPGGHLVVTVPQHPSLWSDADEHAHHVRRYRRRELVERVEATGFEVLRTTSFVMSLLPLMAAARWRQRRSTRVYDPVAELVPPEPANRLLERLLRIECAAIARGIDLPAGGSLLLVGRRRGEGGAPA